MWSTTLQYEYCSISLIFYIKNSYTLEIQQFCAAVKLEKYLLGMRREKYRLEQVYTWPDTQSIWTLNRPFFIKRISEADYVAIIRYVNYETYSDESTDRGQSLSRNSDTTISVISYEHIWFLSLIFLFSLENRAPFGVSVIAHTIRHTAGLLWTSDQPVAETSTHTGQHKI
jgi:hypothetical protein